MKLIRAGILFLCIFMTGQCLFAAPAGRFGIDRRELFNVGYQQLPHALKFAWSSEEFISQLTEVEKVQFGRLYQISHTILTVEFFGRGGPPAFPGQVSPYSRDSIPHLEFSKNGDDFKLNPGEPERLAKTTEVLNDSVMINLNYLNSPNMEPSYLDVLQILFHEWGHKIGRDKNQTAIDSAGAKLIRFLRPFYHKFQVVNENDPTDKVSAEILALPESRVGDVGFPQRQKIIVNNGGYFGSHTLDIGDTIDGLRRYAWDPDGTGNVREEIAVKMTNFRGSQLGTFSFKLDMNLEVYSRFVGGAMMYRPNGTGISVGGVTPMIMQSDAYDIVKPSYTNISASVWGAVGRPEPKFGSQYYTVRPEGWDYREGSLDFRISKVSRSSKLIRLFVDSKQKLESIQLRLQTEQASLLLEGRFVALGGGRSVWQFELPRDLSSESGEIKIRDAIINKDSSSLLPEVLTMNVKADPTVNSRMNTGPLMIFDGKNWVEHTGQGILELPPGPAKLRIAVPEAQTPSQIRLRWNTGARTFWGENKEVLAGVYSTIHEETINSLKLVDTKDGQRIYEFESTGVLKTVLPEIRKGFVVEDSQRRFLKEFIVTSNKMESSSLRVLSRYQFIFNKEYIKVQPSPVITPMSCQGLF